MDAVPVCLSRVLSQSLAGGHVSVDTSCHVQLQDCLTKWVLFSMDGGGLCLHQDCLHVESLLYLGRDVQVLGMDIGGQEWK